MSGLLTPVVGEFCSQLKDLNISDNPGLNELSAAEIDIFTRVCKGLTNLEAGGCHWITDEILENVANGCPNLTKLALYRAFGVTNVGMQRLCKMCKDLKKIYIGENRWVTDETLTIIAQSCPRLTHLHVFYDAGSDKITDQGLKTIGSYTNQYD